MNPRMRQEILKREAKRIADQEAAQDEVIRKMKEAEKAQKRKSKKAETE